jgi:hypothetical protein
MQSKRTRGGTRHQFTNIHSPGSIDQRITLYRTARSLYIIILIFFSPTDGANQALLHCVARNRLAVLPYNYSLFPLENITVENRQCMESESDIPLFPPSRACRASQESVPRKRALQSYVSLVASSNKHIPRNPEKRPQCRIHPATGPEAFLSHLHLLKVGHRPLVIPTILLQTIYCIFDVQTSLLAQSRYLGSLWFRLGRKKT